MIYLFDYTERRLEALTREVKEKDITHIVHSNSTSNKKYGVTKVRINKTDTFNLMEMLDGLEKALGRLEKSWMKEKEEKMNKFKVGDIVRVKPVEEMLKSDIMAKSLEEYACTHHRVNTISAICEKTLYVLDDCEGVYFDETMLADRTYTVNDIFDVNVIVPNKVVEIEFYDGKEKMICHDSDTFDLRKCCFIAISKHLYKKEYTYEGIEYMAGQLMYQKKYVKIVDRAMKDYKKKMDELDKKAKQEEEMKIVRARQAEKKRRYKERRTQRYREDMINLIADSINEAKARRKAN